MPDWPASVWIALGSAAVATASLSVAIASYRRGGANTREQRHLAYVVQRTALVIKVQEYYHNLSEALALAKELVGRYGPDTGLADQFASLEARIAITQEVVEKVKNLDVVAAAPTEQQRIELEDIMGKITITIEQWKREGEWIRRSLEKHRMRLEKIGAISPADE